MRTSEKIILADTLINVCRVVIVFGCIYIALQVFILVCAVREMSADAKARVGDAAAQQAATDSSEAALRDTLAARVAAIKAKGGPR